MVIKASLVGNPITEKWEVRDYNNKLIWTGEDFETGVRFAEAVAELYDRLEVLRPCLN